MSIKTFAMIAKIVVATVAIVNVLVSVESSVVRATHRHGSQQVNGYAERTKTDAEQRQIESDRRTFKKIIDANF